MPRTLSMLQPTNICTPYVFKPTFLKRPAKIPKSLFSHVLLCAWMQYGAKWQGIQRFRELLSVCTVKTMEVKLPAGVKNSQLPGVSDLY